MSSFSCKPHFGLTGVRVGLTGVTAVGPCNRTYVSVTAYIHAQRMSKIHTYVRCVVRTSTARNVLSLRRRPFKFFLQTGEFPTDDERTGRKLPPDHTLMPVQFLPVEARLPMHRDPAQAAPKGNPRKRFIDKKKIKSRRAHYWDKAIDDVVSEASSSTRTWRVMALAHELRRGVTPKELAAKHRVGDYWRALHMLARARFV